MTVNNSSCTSNIGKPYEDRPNILVDVIFTTFHFCYEIVHSVWRTVLPPRRKLITEDVILVTGGGKGLGRLLAVKFAKYRPKHIILWGRTEDSLKATSRVVKHHGVECSYMICDVGDRQQVHSNAQEVRSTIGDVTMLINNAGVAYGNTILDSKPEEIENTIHTNLLGQIWCVKEFLPNMLTMNHGHIVCINSMLGLMGLNGAADYVASKFGLSGYMESLQMELAAIKANGMYCTNVHPYLVDTDLFAGCKTRFPFLFPALDKEYVTDKIVDSVLRNKSTVLMPRIMYLLSFIRNVLPRRALIIVQHFAGVDKSMENFHGRKEKLM